MKVFLKIFICILFIIMCLCSIFYWGWTSSSDPREKIKNYKAIQVVNNSNKEICLILFFCYANDEIVDYSKSKIIIDKTYNRTDTICLKKEYPANHSYEIVLPIRINEKVDFPKSFNLTIYDYDTINILKQINYSAFVEILQKNSLPDSIDPLTLNEWTLVIDSTLLEIN